MSQVSYDFDHRNTMAPGDMKIVMRMGDQLYEIGHLFAYNLRTSREVVPRQAFGYKTSIGSTKGRRSHEGVLIFNVINESIVHEMKEIMKATNNKLIKNGGFISEISDAATFFAQDFEEDNSSNLIGVNDDPDSISAMELPAFDLIITVQNPEYPSRYTQKKIIGITLIGQQGAIGLDTITAQEQYPFVCKHVTPLVTFETSGITDLNEAANIAISEEVGYDNYNSLVIA